MAHSCCHSNKDGQREGSQEERPRLEAITCGLHLVSEDPRAPADGFHPALSGWRGQGGSEHPLSTSPQAGLRRSSPILGHAGDQLCPRCASPSIPAGEPHLHLLTWGQVPGMLLLPGIPCRGTALCPSQGQCSRPGPRQGTGLLQPQWGLEGSSFLQGNPHTLIRSQNQSQSSTSQSMGAQGPRP